MAATFQSVVRTVLSGIAGAVTGFMLALTVSSLPGFIAGHDGGGAGGLALVLGFYTIPLFTIGGVPAGIYARKRFGETTVAVALIVSLVGAPMVIMAAEEAAAAPPIDAVGCRNFLRTAEFGHASSLETFERICPQGRRTIDVSVQPPEWLGGSTEPGNALVLDASADSGAHRLLILTREDRDSSVTITYDSRARVISQQSHVGAIRLHIVPDSAAQGREWTLVVAPLVADLPVPGPAPSALPATEANPEAAVVSMPPTAPMVLSPALQSHRVNALNLPDALTPVASAGCVIEERAWRIQRAWGTTIYRRTCAGEPPLVEAMVVPLTNGRRSGPPVAAFAVDASAETRAHRVRVEFTAGDSSVVFHYDSRARLARLVPRVGMIAVTAVADTIREPQR